MIGALCGEDGGVRDIHEPAGEYHERASYFSEE